MGNALLSASKSVDAFVPSLLQETQIFALWTIQDVKELLKRFQSQIHGFALVEAQFETIMAFKPMVGEHVPLEQLFQILDNDHDGRMDGLELLGGIALCCRGSLEDKARFCFELYDFNLNSLLSRKELAMMMMSCVCGLNVLTGGHEELEPDMMVFEAFADDAIARADLNADGQISFEEFIFWIRSNRDLMSGLDALHRIAIEAKIDVESDDSAPETEDNDSAFEEEDSFPAEMRGLVDDNFLARKLPKIAPSAQNNSLAPARGDQALAVVPWLGQVCEPTNYRRRKSDDMGPETNLELCWAFGNRSKQCVNHVRYLRSSHLSERLVVYSVGAVCIVYHTQTQTQSFYLGHCAEVTCLAVHPQQQIVATADLESNIHLWTLDKSGNAVSLLIIHALSKQGLQQLAFSPQGDKIACVSRDNDHTICLYDTTRGELISSAKGIASPSTVHEIAFSAQGHEIAMAGKQQIKFFVNVHANKRSLDSKLGKIGSQGKRQVFCCVTYMDADAFVGCASGEIYRFRDTQCVAMVQAHGVREPVLCLFANTAAGNILSGGKDSIIKTWDTTLREIGSPIDLSEDVDGDGRADSGSLNTAVVSIQQSQNYILVATRGADIFEVTLPNKPSLPHSLRQLAWGHCEGELWGLAVHPSRDECVTTGDDRTLRVWSLRSHEQINTRLMHCGARAVEFNHSGTVLCVGQVDGSVALLEANSPSLRVYSTWQHCRKMIHDVKFSPDDNVLAIACADTNIYLYRSEDRTQFRRLAVCRGHSGAVLHIDFSVNSQYIQSNGSDYALLYWDTTGNQIRSSSSMRDTVWDTNSCVFAWPVQGMWSPGADYSDINTCAALPDIGDFVCGDDEGFVRLYRCPAVRPGSLHQSYRGHASHVTCVKFNWNRRLLVSVSGADRAILVWRHLVELHDSDEEALLNSSSSSAASSGTEALSSAMLRRDCPEVAPRSLEQEAAALGWTTEELRERFGRERSLARSRATRTDALSPAMTIPAGDAASNALSSFSSSSQLLPWRASIVEPTRWQPALGTTDVDLSLQWVHGHRSHDCRNNVFYSAEGSIVYNAANLAVVYHKPSGRQRFLLGPHTDEVISIAVHPAGQIFASGEAGRVASIVLWDSKDVQVLAKLESVHAQGVGLLAFNSTGSVLASIGLDRDNTLCIHDWSKNVMILTTPTHKLRVLCCCFLVNEDASNALATTSSSSISSARDVLVTGGQKHLKFWWWQGQNVQSQTAIWSGDRAERKSTILCVASTHHNICVTGSSQGNLLIWQDFKLVCNVRLDHENFFSKSADVSMPDLDPSLARPYLHNSSILAMFAIPGSIDAIDSWEDCQSGYLRSARYITGDRDGRVCIWRLISGVREGKLHLVPVKAFSLNELSRNTEGIRSVKSICERDGLLLLGDDASEVFEIQEEMLPFLPAYRDTLTQTQEANTPLSLSVSRVSAGHRAGEVWGLATHPFLPIYFTAGDDCTLRCWRLSPHRLLSYAVLANKARAIDIRPDDGAEIAVALNSGAILIIPTTSFFNEKTISKHALDAHTEATEVKLRSDDGYKELSGPTQWVQSLKYCFRGLLLVAACQDSRVYRYDVMNAYQPLLPFTGHDTRCAATHVDFGVSLRVEERKESLFAEEDTETQRCVGSRDTIIADVFVPETNKIVTHTVVRETRDGHVVSNTIAEPAERDLSPADVVARSSGSDGSLLFWNAFGEEALRISSMSRVKDAWWATTSCPFGWAVQGIWPLDAAASTQTDILAVAQSHTAAQVPVLGAVDVFGRLRLYNFPCVQPGAADKCYRGHSNKVTNLAFSFDDSFLVTTGAQDRCVFVWATDIQDEIRERNVFSNINQNSRLASSSLTLLSSSTLSGETGNSHEDASEQDLGVDVSSDFQINKVFPRAGDERQAVLPWKSAIREPTDWKETAGTDASLPPKETLELVFAHGYRGWDCRNNICFADSAQRIVYHIAACGIVLDTAERTQVINREHDDDVLCVAVHPEGHVVASGEIGKFPRIVVWDANTGGTIRTISGHKVGVSHIAFAQAGKVLVSCGMDDDRTVMVHDAHSGQLLGRGKAGRGVDVYALSLSLSGHAFLTGGKNHIKFWELPVNASTGGLELSCKTGIYNLKSVKARTVCSAAYLGLDAVTGMNDGSLLLWKDRSNTRSVQAHSGPVTAMASVCNVTSNSASNAKFRSMDGRETGPRVLSGGRDGCIHLWDVQFTRIWSLNMHESTPRSAGPQIQALAVRENKLLIGTKAAEIYECLLQGGSEMFRHVCGHFQERAEVWALDVHPKIASFVTAGDDMTVRLWDSKLFRQQNSAPVDAKCRAVAFHPDGSQIAAALYDGKLQVFSEDLSRVTAKVIVSSSWSQCLRFSADGQMLAVGCHDNVIYLLETKSFACLTKCRGHHSFITGIDFSEDGAVLQSVSGDYELLFWSTKTGKQIASPSAVRDVRWQTITCTLGWAVQGIWPPHSDGTDVNTVDRSPNQRLLATGDDFRSVKLFRNPCCKERAPFKQFKGHSEHVMQVKFSPDGKYLFSVGGLDKAILQFEVKE